MADYYFRDLRLQDARYLRRYAGEMLPPAARGKNGKISLTGIRNYLRKLQDSPLFAAYAWEREEETASEAEEDSRTLAVVFCSQNALRSGFWQLEFLLGEAFGEEEGEAERFLDGLLRKLGRNPDVKAVNLHIPEDYVQLDEAVQKLPFRLHYERYPQGRSNEEQEEQWIRLYTLSKTSNWPYTWVFVPTPMGLWAVYGNEKYISALDWLDYEAAIEDIQLRELCMADGYADSHGRLKSREACEAVAAVPAGRHVPATLQEAAEQLRDYEEGRRQYFDLPLYTDEGTRFQRRVWQEIAAIPYGSTRSYEDIGIRLAEGDAEAGRNMTRAVGSACGANPLAVFVPCHRVIAKDKKLQGYAFGVERKNWLLSLEILGLSE